MMKRKAPEPATPSAARRSERAENDNDAAAAETGAAAGAAQAEAAAQQSPALVAELESIWHTIGRALGVAEGADSATRQAALLRWSGFEWGRDGALTAQPQGLTPSPLALHLLPVDVATHVLSLLPVADRLYCACVARSWRTLARLPAAWSRLTWPYIDHGWDDEEDDGGIDGREKKCRYRPPLELTESLSKLAHLLHGARDALLTGVVHLDCRGRGDYVVPTYLYLENWAAAVGQCPSLRELYLGAPRRADGQLKLTGAERSGSPFSLLTLLRAAPALRLPDAHVDVDPSSDDLVELQQLRLLLAHPRASVATLSIRVPAAGYEEACRLALADALESSDAASLRSVYFSRSAAGLAHSLAGALGLSLCIEHVRVHKSLRFGDPSRALPIPLLRPGRPPLAIEFNDCEGFAVPSIGSERLGGYYSGLSGSLHSDSAGDISDDSDGSDSSGYLYD
jgi:hypothetical protein